MTCHAAAIVAKIAMVGLIAVGARIEAIDPRLVDESGSGNDRSRRECQINCVREFHGGL